MLVENMAYCLERADGLISKGALRLLFQAQYKVQSLQITGAEVKLEYDEADISRVVTLLEQTNQTCDLDLAVLREVCRLQRDLYIGRHRVLPIFVPISMRTVEDPLNIYDLALALRGPGVPTDKIVISLTGTSLSPLTNGFCKSLQYLFRNNIKVALGNFADSYTTLATYTSKPFCAVRLGPYFIEHTKNNDFKRSVFQSIICELQASHVQVIGNTQSLEDLDFIRSMGCTDAQGDVLMPAVQWADFMQAANKFL